MCCTEYPLYSIYFIFADLVFLDFFIFKKLYGHFPKVLKRIFTLKKKKDYFFQLKKKKKFGNYVFV